ncbi:CPBP family glutamic-type intramembrane protease [Paludibaculum fermentans]|uniref:CPBP family glutamic-type intramembrane protease n=1 Tax=Paludibaculum fermentans TaxID=1473598 RepID=UPI003EBF495F
MWLPTGMEDIAGSLPWVAVAVLLEVAAYLSLASERARQGWTRERVTLLAPVPYLLYAWPLHVLDWASVVAILTAIAVVSYWFVLLPRNRFTDTGFVVLMAAPLIFKSFAFVYARPHPDIRLEFLGQLLWIRAGVLAVLNDRKPEGIGFGFWPKLSEWKIGAIAYLALLPVVFALASLTGFATFTWPPWTWQETTLRAVGTFVGIFWVVALSEEFFFRGLLQQWIGIAAASILFGLAHLGFRQFPNWQFALVAGVAGVFYGVAFRRAGGIRAAMVTHALTVTTWRVLFR